VKISAVQPQYLPQRIEPVSPYRETHRDKESPSMVPKTSQYEDSKEPMPVRQMSTEDLIKLILAMEAIEKGNEVSAEVLSKYYANV